MMSARPWRPFGRNRLAFAWRAAKDLKGWHRAAVWTLAFLMGEP